MATWRNRILCILATSVLALSVVCVPAFAADDDIASGTWGTCPWEISADGTLTVHPGTGEGQDNKTESPWAANMADITTVVFTTENGKKAIAPADSSYLFSNLYKAYTIDATGLDTSRVTNMHCMFFNCSYLSDYDFTGWDTSHVTDMSGMFYDAFDANSELRKLSFPSFDTSNVTDMSSMFRNCSLARTIDLSNFNTSKVTTMFSMFADDYYLSYIESIDLSSFDTSNVTDMSFMFFQCRNLESLDLSNFNTSKVSTMESMFYWCYSLGELDVSSFNTSNVTTMKGMFHDCSRVAALDVSRFNTSKVTDMSYMFDGVSEFVSEGFVLDVSGFDTSHVTAMNSMFSGCSHVSSLNVSGFDTSSVTNMSSMFRSCSALTSLNLSHFDTSNVTSMSRMFYDCTKLASLNLSSFDTSHVTDMSSMFSSCYAFTTLDLSPLETSNVTDMSHMFAYCKGLTSLDLRPLDTSNVTDMSDMFSGCSSLASIDVTPLDTSNVEDMGSMFYGCESLKTLDITSFDTSKVTSMGGFASYCSSLTSIKLAGIDTSNVISIGSMFSYCTSLTSLDLSGFDVSDVWHMGSMFEGCTALRSVNLSGWDTSATTYMGHMFRGCSALTSLDLSTWDVSKVDDMRCMFYGCSALTSLNLTGWNPAKSAYGTSLFRGCSSLTALNLSGWETSELWSMEDMFNGCSSLATLDLSGWDTSGVEKLPGVFDGCSALSTVVVSAGITSNVLAKLPAVSVSGHTDWWSAADSVWYTVEQIAANRAGISDVYQKNTQVKLTIADHPNSCFGALDETVTFEVRAFGSGLSYQWQVSGDGGSTWSSCGSNAATLPVTVTEALDGSLYRCVVKDSSGASATTRAAKLTVWTPLQITVQPADCTGAADDIVTFLIEAVGDDLTYQWYAKWTPSDSWSKVTVYYTPNVLNVKLSASNDGAAFYCVVTDSHGNKVTSRTATVTLGLSFAKQPTDVMDVVGSTAKFTVEMAGVTSPSYRWQQSGDGGSSWTDCGSGTTGYNTPTLSVPVTEALDGYWYRCLVTDTTGATGISQPAKLTVLEDGIFTKGTWGTCAWDLTNGGELIIHPGEGVVPDGEDYRPWLEYESPWLEYKTRIKSVVFAQENGRMVVAPEALDYLFAQLTSLVSIDFSGLDTSALTSMRSMFSGCTSLTSLDLSGFNTSGLQRLEKTFMGCSALVTLDLTGWDTSAAWDMERTFNGCSSLTSLDLSGWDMAKALYYEEMFTGCSKLASVAVGEGMTSTILELLPAYSVGGHTNWWSMADGAWYTVEEIAANRAGVTDVYTKEATAATYLALATVTVADQTYTGSELTPAVTVRLGGKTLVAGTDYTVVYGNNVAAGTATVTLTGKGDYVGIAKGSFAILPASIEGATVSAAQQTYTGAVLTPEVTVVLGDTTLVLDTDYTVSYAGNVNAGAATVTVTGTGNYTGTASGSFKIAAASISGAVVSAEDQTYTGAALMPAVTVTLGGKVLDAGDYKVDYANNTAVGTATVTVTGKGNYTGTAKGTFAIVEKAKIDLSGATVSAAQQTYTGSALTPAVTVVLGGKTVAAGNYDVEYANNVNAGTATITVTGTGDYTGTATGTFTIAAVDLSGAKVSASSQTYTGSALKPAVTVTLGGKTLPSDAYNVAYSNNVNAGTAAITVNGKGNYKGTVTGSFTIAPAHATGWQSEGGAWYFYDKNGVMQTDYWESYNGVWYYFGADGRLVWNGWSYYEGVRYYMGKNGRLAKSCWAVVDGAYYYIGANYQPVVDGWVQYGGKYFYMDANGNPVVNDWVQYRGTWYHFNGSGVCDRTW